MTAGSALWTALALCACAAGAGGLQPHQTGVLLGALSALNLLRLFMALCCFLESDSCLCPSSPRLLMGPAPVLSTWLETLRLCALCRSALPAAFSQVTPQSSPSTTSPKQGPRAAATGSLG